MAQSPIKIVENSSATPRKENSSNLKNLENPFKKHPELGEMDLSAKSPNDNAKFRDQGENGPEAVENRLLKAQAIEEE